MPLPDSDRLFDPLDESSIQVDPLHEAGKTAPSRIAEFEAELTSANLEITARVLLFTESSFMEIPPLSGPLDTSESTHLAYGEFSGKWQLFIEKSRETMDDPPEPVCSLLEAGEETQSRAVEKFNDLLVELRKELDRRYGRSVSALMKVAGDGDLFS